MGVQRADSIASSGAAHGLESLPLRNSVLGNDYEQDDLLQTPSFEAGIYGVLFTLSQEKNQQHIRYHWILLKLLLDAWQLFTTIISPEMGWDIHESGMLWKSVNVLSFQWMRDLGYAYYVAVLYSMAALLAVNLGLCVWVAWSFKEQKFDYVWPIKVVRGFSYVFLQVFDITSLNFLQLGISCNYMGPHTPHLHNALFPQYSCSSTPHIIHAIVSGMLLLLFVVVAMLVNMSEVEVNPASKSPQALGHSGAEVTAFGIKALMTLVGVFLGYHKLMAVAYLLLALWLTWEYLRWVPHLLLWVNCLKGGTAVAVSTLATMQVAIAFIPHTADGARRMHSLTNAMTIGLGPGFLVGVGAAWLRTHLFTATVIRAFRTTDPKAVKPADVYHFSHPRDVEVAARSARVWTDLYTLDKGAVHMAENIIKAGVALFPDDAFVSLTYANFMLDMLGFSQTGAKQLESVRKLGPGIMCRFMLFVRQQQATQKAASSTVGKGGNMDLLGYVEYQRKQRMVLRHHRDALQAMANFWRILGTSTVSFSSLSKSLEEIDNSVSQAETAYRVVLELYNNSPRLVRLYARFLETIKQDPWAASEYYAAAERLEESKDEDGQGPTLPDGTPINRMDDVDKGVLVVNAFGDIQVANRKLHAIFGYKKGDLDGKNVTVLMPPHEAKRHPAVLRRYIDSGDKAAPYFRHPVLAIHRERVAFIIRIAVSRASGLGEDSVFIGQVEPLPTEAGMGRVWVTPEGVIVCCDPGFVTCFGYHPEDVIGIELDRLLRSSKYHLDQARNVDVWMTSKATQDNHNLVQRLLANAQSYGTDTNMSDSTDSSVVNCSVLHKYDFAKEVTITALADMTKSAIYEVRMRLLSDEPQLLMVVERKGAIRHMSGDLAKILGVCMADNSNGNRLAQGNTGGPGGNSAMIADASNMGDEAMVGLMSMEPQRSLDDFLPQPWKTMHMKYRKYISGGSPNLSGAWGCRAALDDAAGSTGPTMQLVGLHGKPVYVHVNVTSREEEGEPMHVVRMARSSLETAISERRIRLRLGPDGQVEDLVTSTHGSQVATDSAAKNVVEVFGFPPQQLVGCQLWDFLTLTERRLHLVSPPPVMDVIDEAAEVMGWGNGAAVKQEPVVVPSPIPDVVGLNQEMFNEMVTNSLQTPGISWRVQIMPPGAVEEAEAMGNATRAAAVMARRTKQAILRLEVVLPKPTGKGPRHTGQLLIHAELWAAEAVTGVVQLDAQGRVSGILEEEVRPPGLLFGLPTEELVGAKLDALLRLRPGQSASGLLNDSGVAKKSALKASSRKNKSVEKVGPVHYLDAYHRDYMPLTLAVQVVGKPGPGNPVVAVLRFGNESKAHAYKAKRQASGGHHGAAAPHAVITAHGKNGHVFLDLGTKASDAGVASSVGGALSIKSLAVHHQRHDPGDTGSLVSVAATFLKRTQSTLSRAATAGDGTARPLSVMSTTRPRSRAAAGEAAAIVSTPNAPTISGLPAACALKRKQSSMTEEPHAGVPETEIAATTVGGAAGGGSGTRMSSPEKPGSPMGAGPSRRPIISPRMDAGLEDEEEWPSPSPDKQLSGMSEDLGQNTGPMDGSQMTDGNMSMSVEHIKAFGVDDDGDGKETDAAELEGVHKWVATGGKFFKNRCESLTRVTEGAREEEEDTMGSFGATSMANSSHWNGSPSASEYGLGDSKPNYGAGQGPRGADAQGQQVPHGHQHPGRQGAPFTAWDAAQSHLQGGEDPDAYAGRPGEVGQLGGAGGAGPHPDTMGAAGGAVEKDPMDPFADDMSDGGESAISGMSGTEGLGDSNSPADFKRGKRYRKLVKLLDSPHAQKAIVRLKLHTSLALMAAATIHVLCFAFIITAVERQSRSLTQLASAGGAQRYLQQALVSVRGLDQAYRRGKSSSTCGNGDAEVLAQDLMKYSELYRTINNDMLENTNHRVEDLYYKHGIEVWSGWNASTGLAYFESVTLWDMVTRVFVSSKTILQNHATWNITNTTISSQLPAAFLLNAGQTLVLGARKILDALLDIAVDRTVNLLQLTFLILEGCVITSACAIVMVYILRSASDQRYQLYETFLKIPVGLTRALASQTTHLLDDDESENDDDDDGVGSHKDYPDDRTRRRPPGEEGTALRFSDNGLRTSRNSHSESSPIPRGIGAHGRQNSGPPSAGHKGRRSSITGDGGGGGGGRLRSGDSPMPRSRSLGPDRLMSSHYSLMPSDYYRDQELLNRGKQGWFARVASKFWRPSAVQPLHSPEPHGPARRTLWRDSNTGRRMLFFVLLYAFLVILFYSVAYVILIKVKDMVALQAVADHSAERAFRTIFYAQELLVEENTTEVMTHVTEIRAAAIAFRDAYYTLRMGTSAWMALGDDVERFPMVEGRGVVKEAQDMYNIFYTNNECLRLAEHYPCLSHDDRFYELSRSGVDGMVAQLLLELKLLSDEAEAAVLGNRTKPGLNSSHWDFICNVGRIDLNDANIRISEQHVADIKAVFKAVSVMHAVLFLLIVGVFFCFLFTSYLPLLRRMTKEKRRIAEMMSQLPAELDVMRLVSAALLGPKAVASLGPGLHRRSSIMTEAATMKAAPSPLLSTGKESFENDVTVLKPASGPAMKAEEQTGSAGSKAYQTWKDILNRTTNVNAGAIRDSSTSNMPLKRPSLGGKI